MLVIEVEPKLIVQFRAGACHGETPSIIVHFSVLTLIKKFPKWTI